MTNSNTDVCSVTEAYSKSSSLTVRERQQLVSQVLSACGNGKLLHIGLPDTELLRSFLLAGVQAYNTYPNSELNTLNASFPGRFIEWNDQALPLSDESFSTILITNGKDAGLSLQFLATESVRISQDSIFLFLDTQAEPDTKQARKDWEMVFFNNGARKHPAYYRVNDYQSLQHEQGKIAIPLEKVPKEAGVIYPLEALKEERDLHMDMTREPGSRSDAHIIRYMLASRYVRSGDRVLDAACGLGYGAYTLFNCSDAESVLGVDGSNYAIKYAEQNFSAVNPQLTFKEGWLPEALNDIPDNSIDFITSFETLEHVPDPVGLMAEFYRILSPSGRIILSVPNDWSDETGDDPNPFHFHVYTWERIVKELEKDFILESAYAQTADQYKPKINNSHEWAVGIREMIALDTRTLIEKDPSCEWCILVGMKSPLAGAEVPYNETTYDLYPDNPDWKVTRFDDYTNPWLVKGLVTIGHRIEDNYRLLELSREVASQATANSPDLGAALCIQAYQLLKQPALRTNELEAFALQINTYLSQVEISHQQLRWKVSLTFVMAQLWQAVGNTALAIDWYKKCVAFDCVQYSPTLITKQIRSYLNLGLIESGSDNTEEAAAYWRSGVANAEKALGVDWRASMGSLDKPTDFGMSELGAIVELASSCAFALRYIANNRNRTPQWWHQHLRDRDSQLSRLPEIVAETVRLNQVLMQKESDIKATIAQQENHFNELLAWKDHALSEVVTAAEANKQNIDKLNENLLQKDAAIQVLNDEVAKCEQRLQIISNLNQQLLEKDEVILLLNTEMTQREQLLHTINSLNKHLLQKDAVIDLLNAEVAQQEQLLQTINKLNQQLIQKNTVIQQLNAQVTQLEQLLHTIDTLNQRLQQKDEIIEQLNFEVAQREQSLQAIETLQQQLLQKDEVIQQLNLEVAQREQSLQAINTLNQQLLQKDAVIHLLNREIAQREQRLQTISRSRLFRLSQALAAQPGGLKKYLRVAYLMTNLVTPAPVRRLLSPTVSTLKKSLNRQQVVNVPEVEVPSNVNADTYIVKQPLNLKTARPKVLHVIANFMTGGSSRLVVDIYEYLGDRFDQSILTSFSPTPAAYSGITIKEIKLSADETPFVEYLQELQPDAIHMHYWGDCDEPWYDQTMRAADQLNIPVIQNINTPVAPYISPAIKRYVYVSNYVRNVFGEADAPNATVYPGSDFSIFEADAPNQSAIDTIGMVYRLETDKLNAQAIIPFIKVVQKRPQTRVLIVGGGSLMEPFKEAVNAAGLTDNFEFTGYVAYSQLPNLYRRMKLFVAPVWKESFGQVSPFAMNMHVPVVGYDIGAIGEIVDDTSLLAPYGDAEMLSDIIVNLLDDSGRRTLIANRHSERAQAHFSIKAMIENYDDIYAETLAETK